MYIYQIKVNGSYFTVQVLVFILAAFPSSMATRFVGALFEFSRRCWTYIQCRYLRRLFNGLNVILRGYMRRTPSNWGKKIAGIVDYGRRQKRVGLGLVRAKKKCWGGVTYKTPKGGGGVMNLETENVFPCIWGREIYDSNNINEMHGCVQLG